MKKANQPSRWGAWSRLREWSRGVLHFGAGFAAWLMMHPLHLSNSLITLLLAIVGGAFLLLEAVRITAVKSQKKLWFVHFLKWLNHRVAEKLFVRETESREMTTAFQTILGCTIAWCVGPRWICAFGGLLLGLCDPLAKFGRYLPIHRFENEKSVGGALFGMGGGLIGCAMVVVVQQFVPLFPPELSVGHIVAVYAVGVVSAPLIELRTGKWDNFWIIAGSVTLMTLTSLLLV